MEWASDQSDSMPQPQKLRSNATMARFFILRRAGSRKSLICFQGTFQPVRTSIFCCIAANGSEIADVKEFTGEVRISDEDMENLFNDLRLSVITCINIEKPFHGQFCEDAFTDGWHYEE